MDRKERVYRLHFDSKTRWGSTVSILKRFGQQKESIFVVIKRLYREKVYIESGVTLKSPPETDVATIQACVDILKHAESTAASLGADRTPTLHLRDAGLNGIVQKLIYTIATTEPDSVPHVLALTLKKDILKRWEKNQVEYNVSEMLGQVVSYLHP